MTDPNLDHRDEACLEAHDVDIDTITTNELSRIYVEAFEDTPPGTYLGAVARLLNHKLEEEDR